MEIRPHEQTIRVGDGFDASVIGSTCSGRKQWKMDAEWETTDTMIVRVDRATGRITGLKPGAAEVQAYSPAGGQPAWSPVRVTVVPR